MANEDSQQAGGQQQWQGGNAPGLSGVYGRLRITIGGKPVATLMVEGTYVALIRETSGPADATLICADEQIVRKLLRGELNPFIAAMRRQARLTGDRGFGTRVAFGLQAGSPFAAAADKGDLS